MINNAFRKLSLKHHPDIGGDEELFKQINNARDYLLSNPVISTVYQTDDLKIDEEIKLTVFDLNSGFTKVFNITRFEDCHICKGSKCNYCKGYKIRYTDSYVLFVNAETLPEDYIYRIKMNPNKEQKDYYNVKVTIIKSKGLDVIFVKGKATLVYNISVSKENSNEINVPFIHDSSSLLRVSINPYSEVNKEFVTYVLKGRGFQSQTKDGKDFNDYRINVRYV